MKNIIISLAVSVGSLIANAAAINWNASGITASPDVALTAAGQYSAYFFAISDSSGTLSTTTFDAVLAEINKSTAGDISSLASYRANNTYNAGKVGFVSSGNGNFAAGTSISGFVLILDSLDLATAKNYMVAQTAKGDQILTKTAGTSGSMLFSYGSQAGNTWQAMAVPEPTSGLMILLGMAGLALRRKRA